MCMPGAQHSFNDDYYIEMASAKVECPTMYKTFAVRAVNLEYRARDTDKILLVPAMVSGK